MRWFTALRQLTQNHEVNKYIYADKDGEIFMGWGEVEVGWGGVVIYSDS